MKNKSKKIKDKNKRALLSFIFYPLSSRSGFTLIETLVALTVLIMALTGPMVLVTRSLYDIYFVKNKLIAAYLAEEGMELIRNVRENNILCKSLIGDANWDWRASAQNSAGSPLLTAQPSWRIDAHTTQNISCGSFTLASPQTIIGCNAGSDPERLLVSPEGRYGYVAGWTPIPFWRCIQVIQPAADEPTPGGAIPAARMVDVISTVTWFERGTTKTFELRERLYDWR